MSDTPPVFFITGVQRSGTTLLSVLLGGHSAVAIDGYSLAFRLITCFKNYEKILPLNLQHPENKVLQFKIENDYQGRLAEFLDCENLDAYPDLKALTAAAVNRRLSQKGKTVWGDKSPNLQHYLADILLLLPQAKIIHIVRDGRAVAQSHAARAHKHILLAAQEWVHGNTAALVNQKLLGADKHLIIKYENLLQNPETTARKICTFLDLPFEEKMLDMRIENEGKSYVKKTFDTSKINSFQEKITPALLRKVENIQTPLLHKFGYKIINPDTLQTARPLSERRRLYYRQIDNIKLLFRSRNKVMVNRELVETKISLRNRLSKFLYNLGQDFLPKRWYEKMWGRVYNREKRD